MYSTPWVKFLPEKKAPHDSSTFFAKGAPRPPQPVDHPHPLSAFKVHPGNPPAHRTGHLIGDGVQQAGHLVHADHFIPLSAVKNHFVPHGGGHHLRHVQHRLIHANPADDGHAPSPHQRRTPVGEAAAQAV